MVELSDRLKRLNTRLKTIDYNKALPWHFEDVNILDVPEYNWLKGEPIVIRKAYAIRYVAKKLPVIVYDDELIVGVPNQSSVEFGITIPEYLKESERDYFYKLGLTEYRLVGHHAPDWSQIITKGTKGLKEEVEKSLDKIDSTNTEAKDELKAMKIALESLELFAGRYSKELLRIADICKDEQRKTELVELSEILKKVPINPANTFWESVQSFWITYVLLASVGEFLPLGRLDQHFINYYKSDIKKNSDVKILEEIVGCFLIKCNERNVLDAKLLCSSNNKNSRTRIGGYGKRDKYYHDDESPRSENNRFFGQEANNRMMTTVVGGILPDGSDGTNELSYLFLEMQDRLDLLMPTFGVRLSNKTSDKFFKTVCNILRHGQGEPVIYNDNAIIKNHRNLKLEECDVVNYSSDGCWEVIFPGKGNFAYSIVYVLQCIEWTMLQGKRFKTGNYDGLQTASLEEIDSYEKFYTEFLKQVHKQIKSISEMFIVENGLIGVVAPDPLLSTLCDGCIDKGEDFLCKGAKYQHRMILMTGFADAVDSLAVIKKLVFEEKKISLKELQEALYVNWYGYDDILALANKVEKYGNNEGYVDEIAVRLINDYSLMLSEVQKENKNIVFTGGIGTFHMYALWGNNTGATPNGRHAFEPVAPNYSPVPGTNINGPLAAIISSSKADLSNFMTGTPIDIQINAKDFEGDNGLDRLTDIIKGFMELNGQIMTISAYSVQQLREAKINPEKYKDLRVRMGGLSAYFVQLAPIAQDKIIERFSTI